jgi:hypothetical protein
MSANNLPNRFITVYKPISGYKAQMMILIRDKKLGEYYDCECTGISAYKTLAQAIESAKRWLEKLALNLHNVANAIDAPKSKAKNARYVLANFEKYSKIIAQNNQSMLPWLSVLV